MSHPNRLSFEGCLCLLDVPTDGKPIPLDYAHKRDQTVPMRRVEIPTRVAAEAQYSLLGQPLSYRPTFDGHSLQRKCGVITGVTIADGRIHVIGEVWPIYCPEFLAPPEDLGMSYELLNVKVQDMEAPVWRLTRFTFVGAAVLLRAKGACKSSSFRILHPEAERVAA